MGKVNPSLEASGIKGIEGGLGKRQIQYSKRLRPRGSADLDYSGRHAEFNHLQELSDGKELQSRVLRSGLAREKTVRMASSESPRLLVDNSVQLARSFFK